MTLGLDYGVWGMNPAGYHLTSLVLHAANAVVVYALSRRLLALSMSGSLVDSSRWLTVGAAFAALVFAVHPLRVESVAWATERRDVLSGFFYLSSLLAYLRWRDSNSRRRTYWIALALFACALLSKATSMSLPAVLLILNVYPLRRLGWSSGWWSEAPNGSTPRSLRSHCSPPRLPRSRSSRSTLRASSAPRPSSSCRRTVSSSTCGRPSRRSDLRRCTRCRSTSIPPQCGSWPVPP